MSDPDRTPSERKALRSVAILKLTGRNEGEPRKTLGEAIYAVFADCCEAGSAGDLEETDPVVLSALDGWLNLDIALDELPTGTRDELCVQAFTQALEDIEKLHAQVRARLSVQQIQGLLDAAILTARELGQGQLDRAMVPQDQSAALVTRALTTEHKLEKKTKARQRGSGRATTALTRGQGTSWKRGASGGEGLSPGKGQRPRSH